MAFLITSPEISIASTKIFCNPNPSPQLLLKSLTISNEKILSRFKVRLGVKDTGATVLGSNQTLRLYGQFSAPVKPSKEEEEKQNYYLNMGYAIRTLREEFPDLFYRELSFDIYRFGFNHFSSYFCFRIFIWLLWNGRKNGEFCRIIWFLYSFESWLLIFIFFWDKCFVSIHPKMRNKVCYIEQNDKLSINHMNYEQTMNDQKKINYAKMSSESPQLQLLHSILFRVSAVTLLFMFIWRKQ